MTPRYSPELDRGGDFEFRFELERLALLEVDVFDVGPADHLQFFFLHLLLEILREQVFEHIFADLLGELGANEAGGSFAGAETG